MEQLPRGYTVTVYDTEPQSQMNTGRLENDIVVMCNLKWNNTKKKLKYRRSEFDLIDLKQLNDS